MVNPDLLREILAQYQLNPHGIHGVGHWARVMENGRRLAGQTGADLAVVELFAVFHDAGRWDDGRDREHGLRGARLAEHWRGQFFDLPDAAFELLFSACSRHTGGRDEEDVTVQTCWDADRLDLLRVGRLPDPRRLLTEAARTPEMRNWANGRAMRRLLPALVQEEWRLEGYHTAEW